MKIKISKRKLKIGIISVLLIALFVSCNAKPIMAASLPQSNPVTSNKLIDMCLTRSGKVVNADIREDVLTQTRNVLNDTATSYRQWCKDNEKAKSVETFREYLESDAYATLPFRLAKYPLELASFIEWLINGETLLDVVGNDVNDVLIEHDEKGNVTVPTETVNIINQCFENVKGDYTNGWRYVDVISSNEINSQWFGDPGSYENLKAYVESSSNPVYTFDTFQAEKRIVYISDNSLTLYPVETKTSYGSNWTFYNSSWNEYLTFNAFWVPVNQYGVKDAETFKNDSRDRKEDSNAYFLSGGKTYWEYDTSKQHYSKIRIIGKESGKTIIYESLDAIKNYSLGQTPYYLTNRQYSDSVDNSFNVSGEYIQNNGGSFSYEQIREQINNSSVTNDSSVSNIVNDYSQTIINNYNYSSGNGDSGNGDSGGDDSGNNSILDGLGKIISAITDIIGFLLGVIGDVIGLIGSLFTTVFEGIKALGGIFGGFSSLLGEIFVFIPQELISFLVISVECVIGIAIWKKFSK